MREDEWIFERLKAMRKARVWTPLFLAGLIAAAWSVAGDSGFERVFHVLLAFWFLTLFVESLSNWRPKASDRGDDR